MSLAQLRLTESEGSYSARQAVTSDEPFIAGVRSRSAQLTPAPRTPLGETTFLERLAMELWASPTILEDAGDPVGYAGTAYCDPGSLVCEFLIDFTAIPGSAAPVTLAVRQVLWLHPVRRLYCRRVLLREEDADVREVLLKPAGFQREGILRREIRLEGARRDVALFGLVCDDARIF